MKKKHKEILMATIGETPQLITELLFFYSHKHYKDMRHFDEIIIFTTTKGRKLILDNILGKSNRLNEMEEFLNLQKNTFNFSKDSIIVYKDSKGKDINDTVTSENNIDAINTMFDIMREYSYDLDSRITATCAGGRKTMSSMFTLAYQIIARKQDELIHIIAPEDKMYDKLPLDDENKFYYPKTNKDMKGLIQSSIPTLKIGKFIDIDLSNGTYEEIAEKVQDHFYLTSKIDSLKIFKNKFEFDRELLIFSPLYASYLRYFLRKRINAECKNECNGCSKCFTSYDLIVDALIVKENDDNKGAINFEHKKCESGGRYLSVIEKRKDSNALDLRERARSHISYLKSKITKIKNRKVLNSIRITTRTIESSKYIGIPLSKNKISFIDDEE